ncbi:hypothetical protein SCHPADRAFT_995014 [Schizopora paradoxa]|uniref:Uncharacterized protein n=1 Tax=Schizopora paradoxa TaxID=27342 RepID=A0A0H2RY86_9AGAM|nr:hypothetical protein SCHPADRAFT_995014 [Schizopora paradoxa]
MPGPRNGKKKRQQQAKKEKQLKAKRDAQTDVASTGAQPPDSVDDLRDPYERPEHNEHFTNESNDEIAANNARPSVVPQETKQTQPPESVLQQPFITDPGNGPRVKDVSAYLSSFFCIPPDIKDPICAAFAAMGVLEMLMMALPREVAIITWYNRTRRTSRICPACQRIYKLGDTLLDPVSNMPVDPRDPSTPKHVFLEQKISGLCSATCFLLASYSSQPHITEVMRGAYGRSEDEIDNDVYNMMGSTDLVTATMILDGPASWKGILRDRKGTDEFRDQGLGRVMRLTRCEDLGLRIFERALTKDMYT